MRVQRNKTTGEHRVDLGDGNFVPARVQRNKATGESRIIVGDQVFPYNPTNSSFAGQEMDTSTGAPYAARFAIGSAADDSMKLQRARDYFGDSVRQEQGGGISFINPETGQRTLVNPEGFDLGDIFGSGREIASTVAGIPAAIAGGIAGGGVGSLATGSLAASAAGAGAGQLVDAGAAWLARREAEKRGAQPSPTQSPLDAAQEFGLETGLGTVGGVALGGLGRAASKAFNPMKQEIVQAWRNMGQQIPSVASATGGAGGAIYENALGGMMGAAGRMGSAREAGAIALQDALDTVSSRIAGNAAASTPYELGSLAKDAASRSKDAFRKRADEVFSDLSAKWNGQRAKLGNTLQAIDDLEAGLMYNGKPTHTSSDLRQRLVKLLENEMADNNYGLLTLRGVQNARNRLSKMMKTPGAYDTASMDERQIQYLRNALKADYRAAISDPADLARLDAHNQWYSGQKAMRRNLDGIIGKEDAQRLGEALLRSDISPDTVRMLEQVLLPSDFNAIRAGIIRQLGRPLSSAGQGEGQASATSVAKLLGSGKGSYAPETQAALFGQDVADPRLMAQGLSSVERAANSSRTAQTGHTMGLIKSLPAVLQTAAAGGSYAMGDLTGAAGAFAAPWLLSRAATSPRMINWLAKPQSAVSKAINQVLAPVGGVELGQTVAPGSAAASVQEAQKKAQPQLMLENVLDPDYALSQRSTAPQKESYADMLHRYGVQTSLKTKPLKSAH